MASDGGALIRLGDIHSVLEHDAAIDVGGPVRKCFSATSSRRQIIAVCSRFS